MMTFIRPRLRKPALYALFGTVFAAAWVVRGGPTWFLSIVVEVTVIVNAVTVYVRAGEDSDEGALAGSRADERQKLLGLRSRALAGRFALLAAFAGLTITVALKAAAWWPFAVMLAAIIFGYIFGLSTYGSADEDPADDPNAGYQARSPVSQ